MFDILVIGSGIAGLTTALLLAKNGQNVAIVEKQKRPGGLLQSYKRGGHTFATGLHYMGLTAEDQLLGHLWRYLGLMDSLEFLPLDDKGGEHIYIGGKELLFSNDKDELKAELLAAFPHDSQVIAAYFKQMAEETGIGYQTLIDFCLLDAVINKKTIKLGWESKK